MVKKMQQWVATLTATSMATKDIMVEDGQCWQAKHQWTTCGSGLADNNQWPCRVQAHVQWGGKAWKAMALAVMGVGAPHKLRVFFLPLPLLTKQLPFLLFCKNGQKLAYKMAVTDAPPLWKWPGLLPRNGSLPLMENNCKNFSPSQKSTRTTKRTATCAMVM